MHKNSQKGKAENRCVVVFQLLGVDGSALEEALTHKKLTAKGEEVTVSLSLFLMFSAVLASIVQFRNFVSYLRLCITDDQPATF